MQPVALAIDIQSGFVSMQQGLVRQPLPGQPFKRFQALRGVAIEVDQAAGTQGNAILVGKHRLYTLIGQQQEHR